MNLYILRHGIAADRGFDYPDDDLRPLTDKGIRRMRREAKGMDAMGVAPDLIISSTLVRAIQTAEIVQQGLSSPPPMIRSPRSCRRRTPRRFSTKSQPTIRRLTA